jgi:hypothetical protein
MTNSPKLSSNVTSKEATKPFKSHLSLLLLLGLFIRTINLSLRWGVVFHSYKRFLFWACMLHVTCLCVPFESPFGETMWSQGMLPPWWSHHVFNTILPLPRNRKLMGDIILASSRKTITNLRLKFSRLI